MAQIQRLSDASPHPLLFAQQVSESLSFDELVAQSGLDAEIVQMTIDAGLIRPLATDVNRFDIGTLAMLKAGVGLLNSGLPLDELVQLAVRHAQHVESVAQDAVALFAQHLIESK